MPPLEDLMKDWRQDPFEGADAVRVLSTDTASFVGSSKLWKTPSDLTGSASKLSPLSQGACKSIRTSPLSDGSVIGGPGRVLTRITTTHPSRPDEKVLGLVPKHTVVSVCLRKKSTIGLCYL